MEAGGDRLPSERWSFFGPKAIQKSTNDPGMSSEVTLQELGENCYRAKLLAISFHLGNVCYSYQDLCQKWSVKVTAFLLFCFLGCVVEPELEVSLLDLD